MNFRERGHDNELKTTIFRKFFYYIFVEIEIYKKIFAVARNPCSSKDSVQQQGFRAAANNRNFYFILLKIIIYNIKNSN